MWRIHVKNERQLYIHSTRNLWSSFSSRWALNIAICTFFSLYAAFSLNQSISSSSPLHVSISNRYTNRTDTIAFLHVKNMCISLVIENCTIKYNLKIRNGPSCISNVTKIWKTSPCSALRRIFSSSSLAASAFIDFLWGFEIDNFLPRPLSLETDESFLVFTSSI